MKEINALGCKVKEKTTGFAGVITSVAVDIAGCVQAFVTPPVGKDKDGGRWYDMVRLTIGARVMKAPTMPQAQEKGASHKGPMP